MPNPDFTPYVNLTIYDKDVQDIYDDAVAALGATLPNWVPQEGNTEVLLMEALAGEVEEAVFAVNRLPNAIATALLNLFQIMRDSGAAPVANLKFTMSGIAGYTIPMGTQARLTLVGNEDPIVFTTNVQLDISPGVDNGTVAATGDRFTDEANGTSAGTDVELLDALVYVDLVEFDSLVTAGRDPETDEDYFARALARLSRLSDTLVLPQHFTVYALEQTNVKRATTLDNWDGSGGAPGDDPGHVTVAVYGDNAMLSSGDKTALESSMEALCEANLDVHVIDPVITAVNVTATVQSVTGSDTSVVQAAVVAALNDYLNPMNWGWSSTVRVFELVSLMDQVEGVDYVVSITTPASDVALTGVATLVDAGTINITVT